MTEWFYHYDIKYGNSKTELGFKVWITPDLVEYLENCGFLEEDEFDFELYESTTDSHESNIIAQPVYDAVIDYYEDRAESKLETECEKMKNGEVYDEGFIELSSDIDRIADVCRFDPIGRGIGGVPLVECEYL